MQGSGAATTSLGDYLPRFTILQLMTIEEITRRYQTTDSDDFAPDPYWQWKNPGPKLIIIYIYLTVSSSWFWKDGPFITWSGCRSRCALQIANTSHAIC